MTIANSSGPSLFAFSQKLFTCLLERQTDQDRVSSAGRRAPRGQVRLISSYNVGDRVDDYAVAPFFSRRTRTTTSDRRRSRVRAGGSVRRLHPYLRSISSRIERNP